MRLPLGRLSSADLLTDEFQLVSDGRVSVYWVPFERLNATAQVAIVGLTPGHAQMEIAFSAARDALVCGLPTDEALDHIHRSAAFAGAMRTNLVTMLDGIGVARVLEIPSTSGLFAEQEHDVHTTSALRYPVFVNGRNYSGSSPPVRRSPLLQDYVFNLLGPELEAVPGALVVPLGKATTQCIELLIARGTLSRQRCLLGFPHPSGANARRPREFQASKESLSAAVRRWATAF